MLARNADKEWEKFGRSDPYYGVLTDDRFRKDKLTDDSLSEFFKSGQDYIAFVLEVIRTSVDSGFSPSRALDFGCGVGRCSIPLSSICQRVVGVDISDSMLEEARNNFMERSIVNLELLKSDDMLSGISGTFDLINCSLVFQHIPRKRGKKIFTRLVELLSDNGIAAIQFVYWREVPTLIRTMGFLRKTFPLFHHFVNLLYGKPFSEPLMEKNVYNLNRLLADLDKHGCGNLHIRFLGNGELRSVIMFFQKKRDDVPYDFSRPTLCGSGRSASRRTA